MKFVVITPEQSGPACSLDTPIRTGRATCKLSPAAIPSPVREGVSAGVQDTTALEHLGARVSLQAYPGTQYNIFCDRTQIKIYSTQEHTQVVFYRVR